MNNGKGCGCNKKSISNTTKIVKNNTDKKEKIEFSKSELPISNNLLNKGFSMVQSYALSLISRGITSKKVEPKTKKLRKLSCFGNEDIGGKLPPCSELMKSETEGKFYCGACGCGDKSATWLNGNDTDYTKLDYPSLTCPLKMPGFTNYEPSSPKEWMFPISRKYYIETMKTKDVDKVEITINEIPLHILEVLQKMENTSDQKIDAPPDA